MGPVTLDGYRRFHKVTPISVIARTVWDTSYASALVKSIKEMDYDIFATTVTNGRSRPGRNIMPAFGESTEIFPHLNNI